MSALLLPINMMLCLHMPMIVNVCSTVKLRALHNGTIDEICSFPFALQNDTMFVMLASSPTTPCVSAKYPDAGIPLLHGI